MNVFESLMKGLNEAVAYEKGEIKARTVKVTVSPLPNYTKDRIKEIRNSLHVTQKVFADIIGVSKKTIEAWECGKNIPHGPAQRMLEIIDKNNNVISECAIAKIAKAEEKSVRHISASTKKHKDKGELIKT